MYQEAHGLRTVRGIISRWSATDQAAYIKAVAASLNVKPDDTIDLHTPATLRELARAIVRQENGQQPYSDALLMTAVNSALGIK
jgi:hypothetical protein